MSTNFACFAIMKIQFLTYFLSFTQVVQCFQETNLHATTDDYSNETKRVKRVAEYTRWRVDPRSTKEFLVKVPDEDLPKPVPNIPHAVNIHEIPKIVPLEVAHMTAYRLKSPSLTPDDYTRFVPPTTVPTVMTKLSYFEEFALKAKKPLRDESPPSGPEFIERVGPAPRVQVAPLAPIAFPRRSAYEAPLTPPSGTKNIQLAGLSDVTSNSNVMMPIRTTPSSDFFSNFIDDDNNDSEFKKRRIPFIQGSSYWTPSVNPLTSDMLRTASLEPVSLARTSYNQEKKGDFHFSRFRQVDVNNNLEASLSDDQFLVKSHSSQSKDVNQKQNIDRKQRTESSPKDYDANYNLVNYGDDYSTKKVDSIEEVITGDDKNNDDSSSEETMEDLKYHDNIKGPQRTTELQMQANVPPRTSTVKPDYENVEVYYEDPDGGHTMDSINKTEFKKVISSAVKKRVNCDLSSQLKCKNEMTRSLREMYDQLKKWTVASPIAKLLDITNGNLTVMENPIYLVTIDDPSSGQAITAKHTVMIVAVLLKKQVYCNNRHTWQVGWYSQYKGYRCCKVLQPDGIVQMYIYNRLIVSRHLKEDERGVTAGIGARDHHAVGAAMEILRKLLEETEEHRALLAKHRFVIIPIFNPDGYEYSVGLPHRRNWIKNLRQYWDECKKGKSCEGCQEYGLRCTLKPCYGVNLDRNFEYQWIPNEELEAEHPCGPLYAGERQLSEPETHALSLYLHHLVVPLYAFITLKEGEVLGIMYPYSHTKNKRLFDQNHRKNATRAANAAASVLGRSFVAGQTSEFLPLYAGGIEDWVDGHLGIDRVYSVLMFRPTDYLNKQLIASTLNFERVGLEAFSAVASLLMPTTTELATPSAVPPVMMAHGARPKVASHGMATQPDMLILLLLAFMCLQCNIKYVY